MNLVNDTQMKSRQGGFTLLEKPTMSSPVQRLRVRHHGRQDGFTLLEKSMRPSPVPWPRARHHGRQGGFTLLEMLVAIAIFASLSMGAYQVLQGVLTSDEVAKKKEARLSELQLAFTLMERDITQMVPRSGRIDGENNKVLLAASRFGQQSDDWGMAFIRGGWLNPDGMLPRSGLQRVGWRLKDHKLERLSYLYPDPVIGTEPRIQPMLDRVTALRIYFYDKGAWKEEWTQRNVLPYGLAVELDLEDYGTIRRQFLIGAGGQRADNGN